MLEKKKKNCNRRATELDCVAATMGQRQPFHGIRVVFLSPVGCWKVGDFCHVNTCCYFFFFFPHVSVAAPPARLSVIHNKDLLATLHLLVAMVRRFQPEVDLPANVKVEVVVVEVSSGLPHPNRCAILGHLLPASNICFGCIFLLFS